MVVYDNSNRILIEFLISNYYGVTILKIKMAYLRGDPLDENQGQTPDQCNSHWV